MSFTPEEEAELRILLGITNKTVSDLELAPTLAGDMLMEVESGSGTFSSSINNLKTYIAPPASLSVNGIQTLKSNRNAIINGDFNVWQRGTSFSSVANLTYTADRWQYAKSGVMVHDVVLSNDIPTVAQAGRLFSNSLKIDCTTIDSAIGTGDFALVTQKIEGYNFVPLAQRAMTLSFWVKATKTGTYCAAFRGGGRAFVSEYSVNSSNTWEFKTINILPSPASGSWDYTTGAGITVDFVLAVGSAYQTTANAWQTGNFFGSSNQVNACDSTSNDFFIAGVQLEAGSVATPFENRIVQQELSLCQRYFQETGAGWSGFQETTTLFSLSTSFKAVMRSIPSLALLSTNISTRFYAGSANDLIKSVCSIQGGTTTTYGAWVYIYNTVATGTNGMPLISRDGANILTANAEL